MSDNPNIDPVIGTTLRQLREARTVSARQLAKQSGISAAMVSRIENGQVSPSIATLGALARALDVPLISLFRDTAANHADYTHVEAGSGLQSTRISEEHVHDYLVLANRLRRGLKFQAHLVTMHRQDAKPPVYVGHGVVFIHVLKGRAEYGYGQKKIMLKEGDTLTIDAELRHGFERLLTDEFVFVNVQAEQG